MTWSLMDPGKRDCHCIIGKREQPTDTGYCKLFDVTPENLHEDYGRETLRHQCTARLWMLYFID
nr:hypothetical protein [Acidisarcina polymorpha]